MSRRNPVQFAFGVIAEIVAIVILVSLLPRVGLQPGPAEPIVPSAADLMPAADANSRLPVGPASIDAFRGNDPSSPRYVEQHLDRASQGLINAVGSNIASSVHESVSLKSPWQDASSKSLSPSRAASSAYPRSWRRY